MPGESRGRVAVAALWRAAGLAVFWLALTHAAPAGLAYGAALVALATGLSLWLVPPRPGAGASWRALALAPFLVRRAIAGGVDVAARALLPGTRLNPVMMRYRLQRPGGARPVALAYLLSALPGTLVAELDADEIVLHVLDPQLVRPEDLADLERRLG